MHLKNIFPFAVLVLLSACNTNKNEDNLESKPAMAGVEMMNMMETITLTKSNPLVSLKLAGELKPYEQTALVAKVNSYVKQVHVDIGDKVIAGQTLVVLEALELSSQIAHAKAKVQTQEAIYAATKSTYDRMLKANETPGAVARDAIDQITARKLADESQLTAARSAYHEIRNINDYLVIKAPFSGTITSRNIDLGAYVGPMRTEPLLVIENNHKLRLTLAIPEANTAFIKLGDTIRFYVRSHPQEKYFALVSRKSGSLASKLRAEKIEADFSNTNNALKPYMVAETSIPLQGAEATFFVPKMAVVESGMGIYVIAVEDGKTRNIPVRKGRMLEDKIEIFGELTEGSTILKMATEEIVEGTIVPSK